MARKAAACAALSTFVSDRWRTTELACGRCKTYVALEMRKAFAAAMAAASGELAEFPLPVLGAFPISSTELGGCVGSLRASNGESTDRLLLVYVSDRWRTAESADGKCKTYDPLAAAASSAAMTAASSAAITAGSGLPLVAGAGLPLVAGAGLPLVAGAVAPKP